MIGIRKLGLGILSRHWPNVKLLADGRYKFEEDTRALCLMGYEIAQYVTVFPCGHYLHNDCAYHFLTADRHCHRCRSPVFDDARLEKIKVDDKLAGLLEELDNTHGMLNRTALVTAITLAPCHLVSDDFQPKFGKDKRCAFCWGDYQDGDLVLGAECGHYLHFQCAVGELARTSKLNCGLCARSYFPEPTMAGILAERKELMKKEAEKHHAAKIAKMLSMGFNWATKNLTELASSCKQLAHHFPNVCGWVLAERSI